MNSFGNSPSDCIPEHCGFHSAAFPGITDEAALDEDGGYFGVSDYVVACVFDSTIVYLCSFHYVAVNVFGEIVALWAVIEGFYAADMFLPSVVVMDAYED